MALGNSKSGPYKYDTDERLTIDPPTAMMQGLLHLKNDPVAQLSPVVQVSSQTPKQRSIFSEYWKTESQKPRLMTPTASVSSIIHEPPPMEEEKQQSPHRRRRIIQHHKTFTYNYDRNPFQYFGIEEDEARIISTDDDGDDDSDSLNSYERILHKNEVGKKKQRRSNTCPTLSRLSRDMDGLALEKRKKTSQSDTVLFTNRSSQQRLSCLRKSRFAVDADENCETCTGMIRKGEQQRPSVSFEAKIMVHLFPSPVEKWAPTGWSNWFGGWH